MSRGAENKTRLLVIDPMPLARKALADVLRTSPTVEVVAAVWGANPARRKLPDVRPDVLLLDVEPPLQAEVECLCELRELWPLPVVLYTALRGQDQETVLAALQVPPDRVLAKPATNLAEETAALQAEIEHAVRKAHQDDLLQWRKKRAPLLVAPPISSAAIIAVGASTGGTEAIAEILAQLPEQTPGLVLVQHMPAGYTRMFAERLDSLSKLEVKEAADGDEVRRGRALVAPGGLQMTVVRSAGGFAVRVEPGQRVNGHCPSVDVLMHSVAHVAGAAAVGVLLTGMGNDGAAGMKAILESGGRTLAQDEESCVVYGMPKQAYLHGGVQKLAPLSAIPREILILLSAARP